MSPLVLPGTSWIKVLNRLKCICQPADRCRPISHCPQNQSNLNFNSRSKRGVTFSYERVKRSSEQSKCDGEFLRMRSPNRSVAQR